MLDYIEQTSWVLFLKYLDDLEREREGRAALESRAYAPIIDAAHRWGAWAAPKKADGTLDHICTRTGPDLIDYVNAKLFPYLKAFQERAAGSDTIEYKTGEIFEELRNRFQSGYLRGLVQEIDELRFGSQAESTSCQASMNRASSAWAMRGAMAANIAPPAR